ncbi:MAG: sugar ABC transporter ATP-binding protein, partial [Anaerolineae bacterium]|nr:sugar ABC transporter ATP-binding protein [Anaerolineae bacterium]
MQTPNLEMRGITKSFPGVKALKSVNLEAFAGEALALIGANGAGKSTLMNVLGGVLRADEGDILIGGKHVEIHSPPQAAANGIAFVHQEMAMLPTMTIME